MKKNEIVGEYNSPLCIEISIDLELNLLQTSIIDWDKDPDPLF